MSLLSDLLPKKEDKKYFLILGVEEHRVSAAIAEISDQVKLIGSGESEFSEQTQEVDATDIAISTAEKNLPENVLVEKVIFGLPMTFMDEGKIKPEHLSSLRKITKDLSLTPYGFIEYPQALSYYLEKKEESPPTLLLVEIAKTCLTFSLIRIGKMEQNVILTKTDSFVADFENALKHLKSEIFPSRIVLYDEGKCSEDVEKFSNELSSYPWHKHSSFLHTPKIEILPFSVLIGALVDTVGGSLLKELHLEEAHLQEEKIEEEKKLPEESQKEELDIFGFVKDKDISQIPHTQFPHPAERDGDPVYKHEEETEETIKLPLETNETQMEEKLVPVKSKLHYISEKLPHLPSFSFIRGKLNSIFMLIGTLGIVVMVAAIFIWFYPKTTVNLIVYPMISPNKINVVFTTDDKKADVNKNIILARSISEEASGEKTLVASGKKKVGEAARGEVVIYNKTLTSKTFPKGTILGNDNLKFTLDEEVNIASASDTGEGLAFGKISGKVTAAQIGPEGNVTSGTTFTFKDFPQSSYYAKNNQNFTGGTSREVTSISKDDQDKLLSSLSDELVSKAKQNLFQKLSPGEKLLDNSIEKSITSKKFSNDVDTEAKDLKLSLTLKLTALTFKGEDLTNLAKKEDANTPAGYTLDRDRSQIKIEQASADKNGDIAASAIISSYFLPEMDLEKIKSDIAGKSYTVIAKSLSAISTIGGVEIIRENSLPFLNESLPLNRKNIEIRIVPR